MRWYFILSSACFGEEVCRWIWKVEPSWPLRSGVDWLPLGGRLGWQHKDSEGGRRVLNGGTPRGVALSRKCHRHIYCSLSRSDFQWKASYELSLELTALRPLPGAWWGSLMMLGIILKRGHWALGSGQPSPIAHRLVYMHYLPNPFLLEIASCPLDLKVFCVCFFSVRLWKLKIVHHASHFTLADRKFRAD